MRKQDNPVPEGEKPAAGGPSQESPLMRYLKKNPLKAGGTAVVSLGGLFAIGFFLHIGYMPDIDWKGASGLLSSIALVGLLVALILSIGLIVPGWALRSMVSGGFMSRGFKLPALSALAAIAIIVGLIFFKVAAAFGAVLLSALLALIGSAAYFQRTEGKERNPWMQWLAAFVMLTALWIFATTVAFIPFATLYQGQGKDDADAWVALISWLAFIAFSNTLWGMSDKPVTPWMVLVNFGLVLFALSIISNNPSAIPVSAMRLLGLGEIQEARLVVTKDACDIAKGAGIGTACSQIPDSTSYTLGPVAILSRMGNEYLVLWPCPDSTAGRQLILKKEDVIGWSVPAKKTPTTKCVQPAKSAG